MPYQQHREGGLLIKTVILIVSRTERHKGI